MTELSSSELEPILVEAEEETSPEARTQAIATVRKLADIVLISLFCLILLLPLSDMLFGTDPAPSINENRIPASFPNLEQVTLNTFPKQFQAYFDDNFGFRQTLIQGRSILLTFVLHVSPSSQVVLGKDNWLFFSLNELRYYQADTLFNPKQLELAQNLLARDKAALKSCGIHYLVIIAPNKSTIYPDFMPDNVLQINEQSRLDQLVAYLQHSNIDLIDLRPALKQARTKELIYSKTDSHWNEVGAFTAYQVIVPYLQQRFSQIQSMSREDFEVVERSYAPDLLLLMGLQNVWQENIRFIQPHQPFAAQPAKIDLVVEESKLPRPHRPFALETGDQNLPDAVFIHDSFFRTGRLYQLLGEHFHRAAFYPGNYVQQYESAVSIIKREQPDIVIYEVVERALQNGPEVLSPAPDVSENFACTQ